MYNRPDIVNEIKRKKLEWAKGKSRVKETEALTKTVLQWNQRGKRPLGRPRIHQEKCSRLLHFICWHKIVMDGDSCVWMCALKGRK